MDATNTLNEAPSRPRVTSNRAISGHIGPRYGGAPLLIAPEPMRAAPLRNTQKEVNYGHTRPKITPKQELAIPHIVTARSARQGTRAARISRDTLQRWMNDPAFRAELEDQRRAAAALAHNEFQALALSSAHILAELLQDPSPYIRLSAARTMVSASMKVEERQDIRRRINVIDDAIELLKDQS